MYAITAACGFRDAVNEYISKSDPPKLIPNLTAVGVKSGAFPNYIWECLSDSAAFDGELYNHQRDVREFVMSMSGPEPKDQFPELPHGGIHIPRECPARSYHGWPAERWSCANVASGAGAWGFDISEAGRFIAADGNGLRFWYGYDDVYTPSLIGEAMAHEIGGPFIFKSAVREGHGLQGHYFDIWGEHLMCKDLFEAMSMEEKTEMNDPSSGLRECNKINRVVRGQKGKSSIGLPELVLNRDSESSHWRIIADDGSEFLS